jgi:alkanesulfonate monooxygenase SsuD/methylene tetrahydromethanopterin reductase-like flavin-dependent oxidoreductase (luciferase family)
MDAAPPIRGRGIRGRSVADVSDRTETLVGLSLIPEAAAWPDLPGLATEADRGGLDLLGIQDHPYQWRFLDTFALIGVLLGRTSNVRIFPDVANLPLRPPAMLGKTASSLDVMSGGRLELGLGTGAYWDAIEAMGGPRRTPSEAVDALEEAIAVIRLMWSGERAVTFDGTHYSIRGLHPGDPPAHDIELWVGAYGPRMLELIGRRADGWIPSLGRVTVEQLRSGQALIDEAARGAGRDPASIRRLLNVGGRITVPGVGDTAAPTAPVGQLSGGMAGPPEFWHEVFDGLRTIGFGAFVFWPAEPTVEQVGRLAQEVAPLLRDTR